MDFVCCRCGAAPNSVPYCVGASDYEFHCFCCSKSPPKRCIKCNILGDLHNLTDLNKKHKKCFNGAPHVFVFSQPWPPFPTKADSDEDAVDPTPPASLHSELVISSPRTLCEQESGELLELVDVAPETIERNDNEDQDKEVDGNADTDTKPFIAERWVTTKEITTWRQCPRCQRLRKTSAGWVKHAQKCAQNPRYDKPKFFIYVHTKGWCNELIQDFLWERHSNPTNGSCHICRAFRLQEKPLPFMPPSPPRPNELELARERRRTYRRSMKKRQEQELLSKRV
ncbi:uncharacterized protein LOC128259182 [Drosophila gunungcola]|uniref:uncharacterized protein LOC128259182 n=1 Tax=Drosophila gunungcola TaxID=103775 RepID=UPI0022DEEBFF|nr:uncharacterized protein LOC128259182 [Drosophila gunungcola]